MSNINGFIGELVESFELKAGDNIYLASDVKQLAMLLKSRGEKLDFNLFIDLILNEIGNEGNLIIPAFTDSLESGSEWSASKSKPTIGALPNRVFRRKDFTRTVDPLHSVLIHGPLANQSYESESTFGDKSIFKAFLDGNFKQIFLDVDLQNSFTFIHFAEEEFGVKFRKYFRLNFKIEGELRSCLFHTRRFGVHTYLADLQRDLLKNNILCKKEIEGINVLQLNTADVYDYLKEELKANGGKDWYRFTWKEYFRRLGRWLIKSKAV